MAPLRGQAQLTIRGLSPAPKCVVKAAQITRP